MTPECPCPQAVPQLERKQPSVGLTGAKRHRRIQLLGTSLAKSRWRGGSRGGRSHSAQASFRQNFAHEQTTSGRRLEVSLADQAIVSLDDGIPGNLKVAGEFSARGNGLSGSQHTGLHQGFQIQGELGLQGSTFLPIQQNQQSWLFRHWEPWIH
jgi:hypothetical protein